MAICDTITQKQRILLGILDEFVRICDQNNLTYFLGGGSLIGAVRHHGFLPWDDDLDIFMPRKDYEKLYRIWNFEANTKKYGLQRTCLAYNCHFRCIEIVDKETTCIKKYNSKEDIMHGIFIDVMPLDGTPTSRIKQISQMFYAIIFNIYNVQRLPDFENKVISIFSWIALKIVFSHKIRYKIWTFAEKRMSKYDLYKTKYCKELTTNAGALKRQLPSSWFRNTRLVDFEGRKIKIPIGYDQYLTLIFGDYMSLPPKEERFPKHDKTIKFEDLNRPYEEYRGTYYLIKQERL